MSRPGAIRKGHHALMNTPMMLDADPMGRRKHVICIRIAIAGILAFVVFAPASGAQTAPGPRPDSKLNIVRLASYQREAPRRISLTFSNVDVREVLAKVAEYAHVDVLVTPGATGNISINLRGRMAEDAI